MKLLYTLSIYFMQWGIQLASLFHSKAKDAVQGRKHWKNQLKQALKNNTQKIIWFHVSSLGEFEQARPLIIQIKTQYPQYKIILTFFSPSGYNAQKNFQYADFVTYLPFDTPKNASEFLDILQPDFIFFVKYEFWINFLLEIKKRKQTSSLKCFLVSSIFRKHQPFFKWYGKIFKNALKTFDIIFVQDLLSVRLLKKIGFDENVYLSGDTRIDRVIEIAQQNFSSSEIENFSHHHKTIICGSTWYKDEKIILPALKHLTTQHNIKTIIAPHHPDKKNIYQLTELLKQYHFRYCLYTEIKDKKVLLSDYNVMIIDTIGLLNKIYRYGHIAYIGGGFTDGIHNILEPAVYGLPVIFGKKYHKFYEATELVKNKGAFSISDQNEFISIVEKLLTNDALYTSAQNAVIHFINEHKGGVERTMNVMKSFL